MPAQHDISGLIEWTKRDEWRDAMSALLDQHTSAACGAAGIDITGIGALGDYVASAIWGAAFEDLLATVQPDGRNIIDDYLRRRGWKESAATRDYIAGLRHSVISLHEVSGVVPGESMLLRDLIQGGEPVRVQEKRGSEGVRQWDRVATRVIRLRDRHVISGTIMAIDLGTGDALIAALRPARAKRPGKGPAHDPGSEAVLTLPQAASLFTNAWLDAALMAAQGRNPPVLVNAEGDPIAFTSLHFPLQRDATVQQVRRALAEVPALRQENAGFWNWIAAPKAKRRSPPRGPEGRTLVTTLEDGALVLGTLSLKGRRLTLEANSAKRIARGKALLGPVLAGLVQRPLTEHIDFDRMLSEERPPPEPTGLAPEEERAMIRQGLDDHYRRVLDEPLPLLGGRSPRAAAKTPKGREKVADWLKLLENATAHRPPGDVMGEYDFGWMWQELGLESLRH